MLEVGLSESKEKLRQDALWWLSKSADVQKVIIIDIERPSGNIYITAWGHGGRVAQKVKIYRRQNGYVDGDDLVIPFRELLLREPNPNARPPEHDFVFEQEDLLDDLAMDIWAAMGE